MMKILRRKLTFIFFGILVLSTVVQAQIPGDIVRSIQKGDHVKLASYFNDNIELEVMAHSDVYSKAQATQIVGEFFKRNKPTQFRIIDQDKKEEGAQYALGSLKTNNGTFRVFLLLKTWNEKLYIHQLRIWM